MKRKGFTLVELLAVIVILVVIALIAVPQVMKIINQSKEDAERQSKLNLTRAFEQDVISGKYQVDTEYNIEDIKIDNNPYSSGVIRYDSENKDVYYVQAVNKKTGVEESGSKSTLSEPINNSDNSLAKQLITAVGTDKTNPHGYYDPEDGYIKYGTYEGENETPNYIKIPETSDAGALYRAVRIHPDGRILVIKNKKDSSNIFSGFYDYENDKCEEPCTNNFAKSTLKDYLNCTGEYENETCFLNKIVNQDILISTVWDTRCTQIDDVNKIITEYHQCHQEPMSVVLKIGLLTVYDVLKVGIIMYPNNQDTYLNSGEYWWLGTGRYRSNGSYDDAMRIYYRGNLTRNLVKTEYSIRPAFTLKSGLEIKSGEGTKNHPFEIK